MTKYGNRRVQVDNIWFDSQKEATRYGELKLLLKAGEITNLEMHPRFRLDVNGWLICSYVADFRYCEDGEYIVEDVKSSATRTPVYRLKRKLMRAIHGIEVKET